MAQGFSICPASLKTEDQIPRNPHKCWVGVAVCLPAQSQKAETGILEQDHVKTSHVGEFQGLRETASMNKAQEQQKMPPKVRLVPPCACMHTHIHAKKHAIN